MTRLLDEMAETKYRIAELKRGYETGERLDLAPWLTDSESTGVQSGNPAKKPAIEMYAERNGELHVLCHDMLGALEAACVDPAIIHAFRSRLHNVPQCRGV